jgi:hypothetical protein
MTPREPSFRPTTPSIGTGFYVWEPEGAGCSVHLHLAVVDRLSAQVLDAVRGRRGAVCGLLLGRTISESQVILVEDSLALPSDDSAALREKLAQWAPGEDKRLWAVGYYRHRSDGELVLDDGDAALYAREFPSPGSVMLISAVVNGQPVAGFFVRRGAEVPRRTPQEFPLSRLALRQRVNAAPQEAPPVPIEEPGKRRYTQIDAIRWATLTIILLAMAAIGIQQYVGQRSRAGPPGPRRSAVLTGPELGLSVNGTPERVVLKWNRNARAIADGVEGTLSITEGDSTKILMLKPADLASGSLVYFPTASHVVFQLEVTTADRRKVTERVRFLAGDGNAPGRPPQ